jgi:hypothetical protein
VHKLVTLRHRLALLSERGTTLPAARAVSPELDTHFFWMPDAQAV